MSATENFPVTGCNAVPVVVRSVLDLAKADVSQNLLRVHKRRNKTMTTQRLGVSFRVGGCTVYTTVIHVALFVGI